MDQTLLSSGGITVEQAGPILTVTLVRPDQRNAQTPTTWRALASVGSHLPDDVTVVVLRAQGKSFSAGMDRRMFTPAGVAGERSLVDIVSGDDVAGATIIAEFQNAFSWWRECDAVTIAAVQGHAVGAGFQLALAADLMVVADDVQMSMKEASFGLVPDLTGTHPLVAAVGYPRALDICLTTRWIGAEEAVSSGIAVRRAPVADLDSAVSELAGTLTALAPGTAASTKHLLAAAVANSPDAQHQAERQAQMGRLRQLVALMGS